MKYPLRTYTFVHAVVNLHRHWILDQLVFASVLCQEFYVAYMTDLEQNERMTNWLFSCHCWHAGLPPAGQHPHWFSISFSPMHVPIECLSLLTHYGGLMSI